MSVETTTAPEQAPAASKFKLSNNALTRLARYSLVRLVMLFVTVVIGIFLTIMIANMGGYVDEIRRGEIRENVGLRVLTDPTLRNLSPEAREARLAGLIRLEEERLGLNQPFIVRSMRYLTNALTLDLGRSQRMSSDTGSRQVRLIILERLPPTLVLFATADLILFFSSVFIALALSRRYGSFFDKLTIAMAPLSAAPWWFYGIFLILIFAALLRVLPFGGMVSAPPPEGRLDYILSLLEHMILPVAAILVSSIFLSVYNWRTFFLIYSSEDYVEMAKAKGLNSRDIERRYILRPTLPVIITSFALLLISLWTGAPIFETIFQWPGLGRQLYQAIGLFDTPVIVASTVVFAYLLAITVFLLDFVYALVDPRVKVGGSQGRS